MKEPKIELKKIKFFESFSEETNAFTADLYLNGKMIGYVSNDGKGGCTDYNKLPEVSREVIADLESYCIGLPPILTKWGSIDMNLENYIDNLFDEWLKKKDKDKFDKKLQKDMAKGLCFKTDNGYSLLSWNGFTIENLLSNERGINAIKKSIKEHEGKELLNTNLPKEIFN